MKGLGHIDVAQPRDDPLVQESGLDALLSPHEGEGQSFGAERAGQGLRPQSAKPRMIVQRTRWDEVHIAEATGVVEPDDHAPVGFENDMGVLLVAAGLVLENAPWTIIDGEATRHP